MAKLKAPALDPATVPMKSGSLYPAPFQPVVAGREKARIGDLLGLKNFGVNVTRLKPGAASALRHWHTRQDEFIWVLEGELVLETEDGAQTLTPGQCAGFPAGKADGHRLINTSKRDALYLEVGDRSAGDDAQYPDDDLAATMAPTYKMTRKDGTSY